MLLKTFLKDMKNSRYLKTKDAGFNEEEHPRESDGKFTEKGSGNIPIKGPKERYEMPIKKEIARIMSSGSILEKITNESPLRIEITDKNFGADFGMMTPLGDDKYKIIISERCFTEGGSPEFAKGILRHEIGHYLFVNFSVGTDKEQKIYNEAKKIYARHKDEKIYPKEMMANYSEFFSESFSRMLSDSKKDKEKVPEEMRVLIEKVLSEKIGKTKDSGVQNIDFQGIKIYIENPVGSIRSGENKDGTKWETKFLYPYGYIKKIIGQDGDELDCFVGENKDSQVVYLIHQRIDNKYDEDKVMLGFDSEESARDAYLAHYNTRQMLGEITEMTIPEFKQFIGVEL